MLQVATLAVGDLAANCYIIHSGGGSEAIVVDCGGEAERVAGEIRELGVRPVLLVSTHCHADHIGGNAELLEEFEGIELCGHPAEAEWYGRPTLNLSYFLGEPVRCPPPGRELSGGETLALGGEEIRVLHLPGHTPGSIGLLFECARGSALVSGDTLFAGGIGRTDLPGGDPAGLLRVIRGSILALPEETLVLPGHGPETTVGEEKRSNPFVGC